MRVRRSPLPPPEPVRKAVWYSVEMWLAHKGHWWCSGTRYDSPEEAEDRAAEVIHPTRLIKVTQTIEVVRPARMLEDAISHM
jgi:hypothetical protein